MVIKCLENSLWSTFIPMLFEANEILLNNNCQESVEKRLEVLVSVWTAFSCQLYFPASHHDNDVPDTAT